MLFQITQTDPNRFGTTRGVYSFDSLDEANAYAGKIRRAAARQGRCVRIDDVSELKLERANLAAFVAGRAARDADLTIRDTPFDRTSVMDAIWCAAYRERDDEIRATLPKCIVEVR